MPEIEVSRETYNRILEDIRNREGSGGGTLGKYAGRWSGIPDSEIEAVKERLSELREESREKVV